jgi:RNA polymerase sigma-70 factor (ECF subfamily)
MVSSKGSNDTIHIHDAKDKLLDAYEAYKNNFDSIAHSELLASSELDHTLSIPTANQDRDVQIKSLVLRRWTKAYWTARDLLGNEAEAEDICQEALLRVYERWTSFRADSSIDTWFFRILINLCLDHRRHKGVWHRISNWLRRDQQELGPNDHTDNPEQQLYTRQLGQEIDQAIQKLPDKQRTIFVLRYLQDFSLTEIAEITGLSIGTVKTHIFRSLQTMRGYLSD